MPQKNPIDPTTAHFERRLFLNHHVLRTVEMVYRSHAHMLTIDYAGSDEALIQVKFQSLHAAHQECAVVLVGLPNHRFEVMCFHQDTKLMHFTCASSVLNGPRLARFFTKLQTAIIATLAAADASPATMATGKGFVQRVKNIVQVEQLSCYEITLNNDDTITYQRPSSVAMKIEVGGWLHGDGEGRLEFFKKEMLH